MFNNFTYYTPTKVIFGNDAEKNLGDLIKDNNCNKVLVVYGGKSVLKNGVLKKVTDALLAKNVNFVELNGVVPNPKLSKVYEGIELAKKENNVVFGGRLGEYRYYDMHQIVTKALSHFK